MGFLRPDSGEADQAHLAALWKNIGGDRDGQEKVYLHHAKVMMCAIQNYHIDWMVDPLREDERVNPNQIGRTYTDDHDGQRDLLLTPAEISFMTKKYANLYKNR